MVGGRISYFNLWMEKGGLERSDLVSIHSNVLCSVTVSTFGEKCGNTADSSKEGLENKPDLIFFGLVKRRLIKLLWGRRGSDLLTVE